ncbi:MAG: MazG-like family protein [Cellulosilyticaceae bacterium]
MEHFLWDPHFEHEVVCEELTDVLGVDMREIIMKKMDKNEAKYPVEKAPGNSKKYTEL